MATPPMVGVPRLVRCRCGPSVRISCPNPRRRKKATTNGVTSIEPSSEKTAAMRIVFTPRRLPLPGVGLAPGQAALIILGERECDPFEARRTRGLDEHDVCGPQLGPQQIERRRSVGHPLRSTRPDGRPVAPSQIGSAAGPTTTRRAMPTSAANRPSAWCSAGPSGPSSAISPSTANERPPRSLRAAARPASARTAARIDSGLAL